MIQQVIQESSIQIYNFLNQNNKSNMQATLQQKQQFLRQEIMDGGFNAEHFVSFMSSEADNIDLNEWEMDELKGIVKKYKLIQQMQKAKVQEHNEQKQQQEPQKQQQKVAEEVIIQQPTQQTQKQKLKSEIGKQIHQNYLNSTKQKKNKINYKHYEPLFDYEIQGMYKCVQNQPLVDNQHIQITVPEFQIKEIQGFFFGLGASKQVWYHVQTNIKTGGRVKRLNEDFEWLSQTLNKLYPYVILPQLDSLKKDIENANEYRRKQLEEFMQQLSLKKFLLRVQPFIDFMTLTPQKLAEKKKVYDPVTFVKGVSLLKNEKGQVQINLSSKARHFVIASRTHFRKSTIIHENIQTCIVKLLTDLQTCQNDYYSIVDKYAQLHDAYSQFTNQFPKQTDSNYSDMLVNLNNLFLGMGNHIKANIETLNRYYKDYYKITSKYDKNHLRLQKMIKEAEKDYLQYKITLYRKKQRLVNHNGPEKWDINPKQIQYVRNIIGELNQAEKNSSYHQYLKNQIFDRILPKQGHIQKQMKMWFGFMLSNYMIEVKQLLKNSAQRYAKKFKLFGTEMLSNNKIQLESLSKFLSEVMKH